MRPFLAAVLLTAFAGCNTKTQDATVLSKEFIPAQILDENGPVPGQNERAVQHDQWLVHIQMADRFLADVNVEQPQWVALRVGDKVEATYAQGKYTGTVWSVSIRRK